MSRAAWLIALGALAFGCATGQPGGGDYGDDAGSYVPDDASPPPPPPMRPADCGELTLCGATCVDLDSDPNDCGACGRSCVIPNAVAGCQSGECVIDACDAGHRDADGDPLNGCEALDGGGGGGGGGGGMCVPDRDCMTACGSIGATVCMGGMESCATLPETCNALDDDCNGECDEGRPAGCRSAVHRAHGDGHLYTTDAGLASTAPFSIEASGYFHVYAAPAPGLRPLFLCQKGNGKYLLTDETDCEIGRSPVATLGYWSPTEKCGAVPLYRLHHAATNNHFYTRSAAERDNAVSTYGYVAEGIAGYVWAAP